MSKSDKYNKRNLDDNEGPRYNPKSQKNRIKERRFERALRTKNLEELIDLEDEV